MAGSSKGVTSFIQNKSFTWIFRLFSQLPLAQSCFLGPERCTPRCNLLLESIVKLITIEQLLMVLLTARLFWWCIISTHGWIELNWILFRTTTCTCTDKRQISHYAAIKYPELCTVYALKVSKYLHIVCIQYYKIIWHIYVNYVDFKKSYVCMFISVTQYILIGTFWLEYLYHLR